LKEVLAELVTVERKLAAAKARIEYLEAEPSAFSTASETERQPLDAETREKSAKIHAYWFRGGTHNERTTAVAKLYQDAKRKGWKFADFIHECGLEM
jgi:hypothetical protein